jgi:hypothetical protein
MITQIAPVPDALSVVNSRCLEIIDEIASSGRLATVDFVLQVLLQRFGVVDFSQLNVGKITDVPSLFLLLEIHNKVRSNVSSQQSNSASSFSKYHLLHISPIEHVSELLLWIDCDNILRRRRERSRHRSAFFFFAILEIAQ